MQRWSVKALSVWNHQTTGKPLSIPIVLAVIVYHRNSGITSTADWHANKIQIIHITIYIYYYLLNVHISPRPTNVVNICFLPTSGHCATCRLILAIFPSEELAMQSFCVVCKKKSSPQSERAMYMSVCVLCIRVCVCLCGVCPCMFVWLHNCMFGGRTAKSIHPRVYPNKGWGS